jgi:carbon storage regulator
MLVLSRRAGERIQIGDSIVITVVRVGPQEVRLGIEAPKEIEIVRSELIEPDSSRPGSDYGRRERCAASDWAAAF